MLRLLIVGHQLRVICNTVHRFLGTSGWLLQVAQNPLVTHLGRRNLAPEWFPRSGSENLIPAPEVYKVSLSEPRSLAQSGWFLFSPGGIPHYVQIICRTDRY